MDKLLETLRVECVASFVEQVFSRGVFLYWLITRDGLQDRTSYQVGGLFVVLGYESDLCILCGGYAYGKCGVMSMYAVVVQVWGPREHTAVCSWHLPEGLACMGPACLRGLRVRILLA